MGFWTDWLDPNIDGKAKQKTTKIAVDPGADARSKLDKLSGVPRPYDEWCSGCQRPPARCNCDKKLGRPRKWYE